MTFVLMYNRSSLPH